MNSNPVSTLSLPIASHCWMSVIVCVGIAVFTGCGSDANQDVISEEDAEALEAAANAPMGLELGDFEIMEMQPLDGKKSTLSFQLYANVRTADFEKASSSLEQHQHTVRDQVITAVRVAEAEEYDDPALVMLRRRIQSRLRRAIPQLVIQDILITDFHFSAESV